MDVDTLADLAEPTDITAGEAAERLVRAGRLERSGCWADVSYLSGALPGRAPETELAAYLAYLFLEGQEPQGGLDWRGPLEGSISEAEFRAAILAYYGLKPKV